MLLVYSIERGSVCFVAAEPNSWGTRGNPSHVADPQPSTRRLGNQRRSMHRAHILPRGHQISIQEVCEREKRNHKDHAKSPAGP